MGVNNAARKNLSGFLTVALMAALLLAPSIGYAHEMGDVATCKDGGRKDGGRCHDRHVKMGDVATTDTLW